MRYGHWTSTWSVSFSDPRFPFFFDLHWVVFFSGCFFDMPFYSIFLPVLKGEVAFSVLLDLGLLFWMFGIGVNPGSLKVDLWQILFSHQSLLKGDVRKDAWVIRFTCSESLHSPPYQEKLSSWRLFFLEKPAMSWMLTRLPEFYIIQLSTSALRATLRGLK